MKQFLASGRLSTLKLALLMATFGFSLALATSHLPSVRASGGVAEPRVLGTNATRPPVIFLTGSDLGAVVVGTQFARQILVQFGFKPHVFTFGNQTPVSPEVKLTQAGKLYGKETVDGVDQFDIVVTDKPAGQPQPSISRRFTLRAVDQTFGTPLHIETGEVFPNIITTQAITLPVALAGDVYCHTLHGNGGRPPYLFEVLEQASGRFLPQGLAFDQKQGLLFGKPVAPTLSGQPAIINVRLTDAAGGQVNAQLSLTILQGTISSQAVATQGNIKLNFGNEEGRDSLSLTLLLDKSSLNSAGIRQASDLEGLPIEINFGGYTLPPEPRKNSLLVIDRIFNNVGRISLPRRQLVQGDVVGTGVTDVEYSISLDPKSGVLKASFKNLKMIRAIGANFLTFEGQSDPINRGPVVPINIRIGLNPAATVGDSLTVLDRTDLVKFVYKRVQQKASGTASRNDNIAPAGVFLINKVNGIEKQVVIDKFNNFKEDRIFLKMTGLMRQPGARPVVPLNTDRVDVFINQLNLGTFPANSFAVKGSTLTFSNDDPSKGLKDLIIDNKTGRVTINTHGLDPNNKLFGVDVLIAGEPQEVPITLTIGGNNTTPTFDGQSTVTLFRFKVGIKNK